MRSILLVCMVTLMVCGCTRRQADDEETNESTVTPLVTVKIALARRETLETFVNATGKTDVLHKEKVLSPVSGTLTSLRALEGMAVKAGDLLAIIRPKETQAAITGAEALLRSAKTAAEQKEAQAALDLARETQNVVNVRARFDGVISTRNVSEGEIVAEDSELMTLVDLSTMIFVADVSLQDIPQIHRGQSAGVSFQSLPGVRFPSIVDAVNPRSDLQSQTVGVRLRFTGELKEVHRLLKTDMMGVARIVTGAHRNVLAVPKAALLRDDEKNTVSVVAVTPDSLAHILPVTIGATTDSTAEVRGSGLVEGMQVIVEGNYALPDSTKVRW